MNEIKLIRLKSGEDIISFVEDMDSKIRLNHPLNFYMGYNAKKKYEELVFTFWLPVRLIKYNSATISSSDILYIVDPKSEFREYYINYLDKYLSNDDALKKLTSKILNTVH